MKLADFVVRADQLIALGDRVYATKGESDYGDIFVSDTLFAEFRSATLSFLTTTFGAGTPYVESFEEGVKLAVAGHTQAGLGILRAARGEIAGGWQVTAKGLVSAEIFADFLEMAEYLLENDFKDAAAVMAGGVLEEHLRQLCRKNGVDVELQSKGKLVAKKAEAMNTDLASAGVYGKLDQKAVTNWLDLRNKAAHAKYDQYTKQQVELMLRAVAEFMARVVP